MTALLASVCTVDEAALALANGADIIDLKDPRSGALGALPLASIEMITAHVRAASANPVSATIGDLDDGAHDEMIRRVQATAATGVDFVKVGIARGAGARMALRRLAELPARVVPLFLADDGIDFALVEAACSDGFPIVMVDTADKKRGSLFACVGRAELGRLVGVVRAAGAHVGLAGSLGLDDVAAVRALGPDIAGFRGALCDTDRTGALVPERVRALRAALGARAAGAVFEPSPAVASHARP
jgi:uncharacterized protein (UPF0264 family)